VFSFKKKAPKKAQAKPVPPKPTKKAAGAKAPVAPTSVIVAHTDKKAEPQPPPMPVTTLVQPVPEPIILPNPDPPVRPPDPPKAAKPMKGLTPDEERAEIEKQILSLQARLWELDHPFKEFPKMVKGVTFQTREEQDKAGKEYADKS
jgi:hypothetical protein